ncbi:MAG: hypothetical protein WB341_06190 [Terracidiphilus sp.]
MAEKEGANGTLQQCDKYAALRGASVRAQLKRAKSVNSAGTNHALIGASRH